MSIKRDTLLITWAKAAAFSACEESFPVDVKTPYDAIVGNRWQTILVSSKALDMMVAIRGADFTEEWLSIARTWVKPGGSIHVV